MQNKVSEILAPLKEKGGRNTPLKNSIVEFLLKSDGPVSAIEIIARLGRLGFFPNKTTVYRQLAILLENDIVETVHLDASIQMFELKKHHHHHFVCNNCNDVIDVECGVIEPALHSFVKSLSRKNLQVTKHEFALYGLCPQCN